MESLSVIRAILPQVGLTEGEADLESWTINAYPAPYQQWHPFHLSCELEEGISQASEGSGLGSSMIEESLRHMKQAELQCDSIGLTKGVANK